MQRRNLDDFRHQFMHTLPTHLDLEVIPAFREKTERNRTRERASETGRVTLRGHELARANRATIYNGEN